MKKKLIIFSSILLVCFSFAGCGRAKVNLADHVIEERNNLFTAQDELYFASLSTGMREQNYALDGIKNEMTEFGVVTFSRLDGSSLSNDNYTYLLTIGENSFTGFLEKNPYDNSYSIDVGAIAKDDDQIHLQITFTGYSFNKDMVNTSKEFNVDVKTALKISTNELGNAVKNVVSNKNTKIEVVTKILKDYSCESHTYYWYIGVISTDGDTLGILIDAINGEVVAKKI